MTTKELFESIGFDGYYRTDTENFYYKYFESETAMHQFIIEVLKNDDDNNTHRRMINQVRRFVELANDIDKVRPGCDSLRIMFLRCGLESLNKLSNCNDKKVFYKTFSDCVSNDGKKYILDHFQFDGISIQKGDSFSDFEDVDISYTLSIDDFWDFTKCIRDSVVHDGNYWETQLFSNTPDCHLLTHKISTQKILPNCYIPQKGETVYYGFSTTMQYEIFIRYFVEGCINYILKYVRGKETELHNE